MRVRSPRNASQTPSAASRIPASSIRASTSVLAAPRATTATTPLITMATPKVSAVRRRSVESQRAAAISAAARASKMSSTASAWSAARARSATHGGGSTSAISMSALPGIAFAICGRSASIAPRSTEPTSASVSATVFWSCWKIARCRSRTPERKTLWNTLPPTSPSTTLSITGRTAIRSARALITRSSVTRVAISARTASSSSAALARLANSFESNKALFA